MPDTVSLTCPNCAGRLEIPPDVDRFACSHCGTELSVKRGGGIILLNPVRPGQVPTIPLPPTGTPPAAELPPIPLPPPGTPPTVPPPPPVAPPLDRAAAGQAIRQVESEIAAISAQINDLNAQMQFALADLAAVPPVDEQPVWDIPTGSVPFYLTWFQGRAWWKSLFGGLVILTAISCLFFCAVAMVDPGQTKITNQITDGTTVSKEERTITDGSTALLCLCCAAYPVLFLFIVYGALNMGSRQKKIKRKNDDIMQGPLAAAEQDARRSFLLHDFQARRAPLEAELEKKKRQLAEQRRILGG